LGLVVGITDGGPIHKGRIKRRENKTARNIAAPIHVMTAGHFFPAMKK
jgi:hypothetical protein